MNESEPDLGPSNHVAPDVWKIPSLKNADHDRRWTPPHLPSTSESSPSRIPPLPTATSNAASTSALNAPRQSALGRLLRLSPYVVLLLLIALAVANRERIPTWWAELAYRKPNEEWLRAISLQKLPSAFPDKGGLAFHIDEVSVLREAPGEAHITVNGTATTRQLLYEIVPLDDPALDLRNTLDLLRSASDHATHLRQRGGVDVPSPALPDYTFVRQTTPVGRPAQFQFQFRAAREGTSWRVENVLSSNFTRTETLSGKPLTNFPNNAAIVNDPKGNHQKAELIEKIEHFAAAVDDAEKVSRKRFAGEGKDPEGIPLFPPDRAMPGERFPETRMRTLQANELQSWSEDDLQYAINEVMARHGAEFPNPKLSTLFQTFGWYHPQGGRSFDEIERSLPNVELQNLKTMAYVRTEKRDFAELDRAAVLQQRAAAAQQRAAVERQRAQEQKEQKKQNEALAAQQRRAAAQQQAERDAAAKAQRDAEAAQAVGSLLKGIIESIPRG